MSQCCKVYQMHAIVTTVTAIFYFVFFCLFVLCFLLYLTRQQSIWSGDAQKFIYDFYTRSLFLLFDCMPLFLFFLQYTFPYRSRSSQRSCIFTIVRRQCSYFCSLPVSCASVKRVCEVYRLPKVFNNGDS